MRVYAELLDFHCLLADAIQVVLTEKCWWLCVLLMLLLQVLTCTCATGAQCSG